MSGISIRVHDGAGPTVIYLPGIHGDWGLIGAFRRALGARVRFIEFAYTQEPLGLERLAELVHSELSARGVESGWILGQSFGSQVGWALIARGFRARGMILAGGFVKHPWPWGARLFRALLAGVPAGVITPGYRAYSALANAFSTRGPEESEEILAFARGRGAGEWKATTSRLSLIAEGDPRPTARAMREPVHYLGGMFDVLVPWPIVTRWLKRECPGYKGEVIIRASDHNVLGCSPRESAAHVLSWISAGPA